MSDPSAVITTITDRAWLTGTAQFFLDPEDSLPEGFYL
ncbi:proline racemase family protein [Streptomyces sp. NPDC059474]